MIKMLLIIGLLLSFCNAEQVAVLTNGQKIIVFKDGTWKPYTDSSKNNINTDSLMPNNFDTTCNSLTLKLTDKMTGKSFFACNGPINIAEYDENSFQISLMLNYTGTLIMLIQLNSKHGCIDKGDKVNILFTDNTRLELSSDGEFNCKPESIIYLNTTLEKKNQLKLLLTKKISTIRVWTNDSFVENDFSKEVAERFYYTIRCLAQK